MTVHDFIFTQKKPQKYYRHIVFWLAQYIFWAFWAGTFFYPIKDAFINDIKNHCFGILDILYIYITVYYFFPKYWVHQRKKFIFCFSVLTAVIFILNHLFFFWLSDLFSAPRENQLLMLWYLSINFFTSGPPVTCALFLTIKMLKNYYYKVEEKKALTKENANAEMQLLKAQVHPHFLFNTLNNIYSFALSKSPKTGSLVLKLSDTLRYMIYECEEPLVPLEDELKMINDYIGLEKVRYGNKLKIETYIYGEAGNKRITPLLLIPFLENSFKHGASKILNHPWIKMRVQIENDHLYFELENSKPLNENNPPKKNGIGLKNVQKRLMLLYPQQHQLKVESGDGTFSVNMEVPLIAISP